MARIAMVIQRYLPHVGGAERQLQQLAPRLKDLGFELHILTRHEKGFAGLGTEGVGGRYFHPGVALETDPHPAGRDPCP